MTSNLVTAATFRTSGDAAAEYAAAHAAALKVEETCGRLDRPETVTIHRQGAFYVVELRFIGLSFPSYLVPVESELERAAREGKARVVGWMLQEASEGRLVAPSDAPDWLEYSEARRALDAHETEKLAAKVVR